MPSRIKLLAARYEPVLLGVVMGALFYAADALMDAGLFGEGSLVQQLFAPTRHELSIRLLAFSVQLLFVVYTWRIFRNRGKLEGALAASQREVVSERARAEAILDAISEPISVQGRDFRILYQNRAHRRLKGSHLGEFCYQAYQGVASVCSDCHLQQSFAAGASCTRELTACGPEGPVHLDISASPLRDSDGRILAGIEIIRDVTASKRAERQVSALNVELARQAGELAAANEELRSFAYSLSHDLRSPLTQINMAVEILGGLNGLRGNEEGEYFIRVINQAGQRMEELIKAILVLSRVNQREPVRERVDLGRLAEGLGVSIGWRTGRQVRLDVAPGLHAEGDPELLKLMLENLLENAWKFTAKVAQPQIEIGRLDTPEPNTFYVRDNGAGFDMTQAHRLFTAFQRLHAEEEYPGTGIGLATVQRIVGRHGGQIRAEGAPGQGATFIFSLP